MFIVENSNISKIQATCSRYELIFNTSY